MTVRLRKKENDSLNRLTNMVDAVGTSVYTYDAAGQLLTEDGPFASDTVTNAYSNRLRTSLALAQPTGTWTNGFGYDGARRLVNVISPAGSFTNEYSTGVGGGSGYSSHLIKRLLLPNLSIITNDFDSVARQLGTWLRNSSGTLLDSYAYLYNAANQRTNLTRADSSTVGYRYDNIGQLKVAASSVSAENRGYLYDAVWNLNYRTNNGVTSAFSVGARNQLTSEAGTTCYYDANGNPVQVGDPTTSGGIVYTYDDENRLSEIYTNFNVPSGPLISGTTAWRTDFLYHGLGRLRKRLEYVNETLSSTVTYIYDGNRVIRERNASNTPTVSYTRGSDLSGSLEGAGGIGGLLARSSGYSGGNWATHNFYFADGNGNVTYVLDGSQAMVASYRYDPFGNTISSSGSLASANVYRFSSKEIHVNSGMYYYLYRFYDPNLQRWINRDPLDELGFKGIKGLRDPAGPQLNLYMFAANDPADRLDPVGLKNWEKAIDIFEETIEKGLPGGEFAAALRAFGACSDIGLALAYAKRQYDDCMVNALGDNAAEKACDKKWDKKIKNLQKVYDANCKCEKKEKGK